MEKSEIIKELMKNNNRNALNALAIGLCENPGSLPDKLAVATIIAEDMMKKQQPPKPINEIETKADDISGSPEIIDAGDYQGDSLQSMLEKQDENPLIVDSGEKNAPALELSKEEEEEVLEEQSKKYDDAAKLMSKEETYSNGNNEWVLIHRIHNPVMGYEHKTMAMLLGSRGVLVSLYEKTGNTATSSLQYVDNGRLQFIEGKWNLK